ncbi:hypothetical protein MYXO_01826 [Myxococcaceae bacterium]|nr:hypothetical protein MYXO_01826 [Myxococcaceae bacterium]
MTSAREDAQPVFGEPRPDRLGHVLGADEREVPLGAQDQEPDEGFIIGMLG